MEGLYNPLCDTINYLNTDAKLFTKLLANRLNQLLPSMINPYQTGFMPDRLISDNGWVTQAIMQHYSKLDGAENIPAIAACFDQEKAYDRVHPEYLMKTMLHFGFPISLAKTLIHLFFDTQISLSINGWLGVPFRQRRGLRQGDPLSPLLFNLAFEPFLRSILASPGIKGVRMDHTQTIPRHKKRMMYKELTMAQNIESTMKILAYADDLLIFFNDPSEWQVALDLFKIYSLASNSKINIQKTYLISLSGKPHQEWISISNNERLQWHDNTSPEAIIYLGYPLSSSNLQLNTYLESMFLKISRHIQILKERHLSIRGASLVTNSLILSRLWHVLRVVKIPSMWLQKIQKLVRSFLYPFWPAPSWDTACLKKKYGGLNIVNPNYQRLGLQLVYIQRLLRPLSPSDFCSPLLKDLMHYYSGTDQWDVICNDHKNINKLVNNLSCLSNICETIAALPPSSINMNPDNWVLKLSFKELVLVSEAKPGNLRQVMHPSYHWHINPPVPPMKIPSGWRLSQDAWKSFWKIKLPHKATTVWWRFLHESISTKARIQQRSDKMITDNRCNMCKQNIEDDYHFFVGCQTKDHIWLDGWPGPSFPPSQSHIWDIMINPVDKDKKLLIWVGKVMTAIWQYHWQCTFEGVEWQKKVVITILGRLM